MSGAGVPLSASRRAKARRTSSASCSCVPSLRRARSSARCGALQRLRRQIFAEHEPRLRQYELQIGRQALDHRLGKAVARARGGAIELARQQLQRRGLLLHVTAAHLGHCAGVGQLGETRRDIVGAVGSQLTLDAGFDAAQACKLVVGPLARQLGGFGCLLQRGKARIVGRLLAPGGAIAHRGVERRLGLGRCRELFLARAVRASGGPSSASSVAICSAWPAMRVRRPTSSSRAARSWRAASIQLLLGEPERFHQLLGTRLQLVR